MKKTAILIHISAIILLILISGCQRSLGQATIAVLVTCEDTDSGLDYYHFGQVTYRGNIYEDRCLDSKTLVETYCINNRYLEGKSYTCEFSCSQGICTTE